MEESKKKSPLPLDYYTLMEEYIALSSCLNLDRQKIKRLDMILSFACQDPTLNSFIKKADEILSSEFFQQNSHLIRDETNIGDQLAWIREHLGVHSTGHNLRKSIQKTLQKKKGYNGPIDGILGKNSLEAIDRYDHLDDLEMDMHELMHNKKVRNATRNTDLKS